MLYKYINTYNWQANLKVKLNIKMFRFSKYTSLWLGERN